MASFDMLANAFGIGGRESRDTYKYGTVATVNANGTAEVTIGNNRTTCSCLYTPHAGDRVQVCIKRNGKCVVLGKV